MEIVKKDDLEGIPEIYKPYVLAFRSDTIREAGKVKSLAGILTAIIKGMEIADFKVDKERQNEHNDVCKRLSELFYDNAMIKYPAARLGQIELAFKNGALKEYGDYFGWNLQTLHGWFKAYQNSKEKADAIKEYYRLVEKINQADAPVVFSREAPVQLALSRFSEYKETGKLGYFPFAIYNIINNINGVEMEQKGVKFKSLVTDKGLRRKVYNQSRSELEKKYSFEKSKAEKRGELRLAESIGEFLCALDNQNELHNKIKEAYLKIYFDDLIKNNQNLILKYEQNKKE